jgi:hypothetical protein
MKPYLWATEDPRFHFISSSWMPFIATRVHISGLNSGAQYKGLVQAKNESRRVTPSSTNHVGDITGNIMQVLSRISIPPELESNDLPPSRVYERKPLALDHLPPSLISLHANSARAARNSKHIRAWLIERRVMGIRDMYQAHRKDKREKKPPFLHHSLGSNRTSTSHHQRSTKTKPLNAVAGHPPPSLIHRSTNSIY